jgi:hypothetical protein
MERVKRYIGEDLTIKILCQEKIVYEGPLNETVEINYFFPEMRKKCLSYPLPVRKVAVLRNNNKSTSI